MNPLLDMLLDAILTNQAGTVALRRIVESVSADDHEWFHLELNEIPADMRTLVVGTLALAEVVVPGNEPLPVLNQEEYPDLEHNQA